MKTVIALFDDRDEAMRAYAALQEDGFAQADLDILTNDDQDDVPKLARMREYIPAPDVDVYLEGVKEGGTIITANVSESSVERAAEIMSSFNMVNIRERAASMQGVYAQLSNPDENENVLEVIEESLDVDKEEVERGRMRIYTVVTEREVQQDVKLRDETLKVRRRPVNRSVNINPDLFKQKSFEMVEIDEIAKVQKTARVVEEVSLGKEVVEKIETIKDTLRRQDVEIEEVKNARTFADYDSEFRNFYNTNLNKSGVTYEELQPAFNYGHKLATTEPFRSSPWSAVEPDAKRIWEEKNPGTWEQNQPVIKYAWEKVRSER